MSHQVTITRTTTTTTTSAILVNTGYIKSWPGILKFLELILGAVCVGIVAYYVDQNRTQFYSMFVHEFFFLLMTVAFLIGTFCLFLSCVISLSAGTVISKTIYEVIYHGIAFILYLAASLTLIIEVNNRKSNYRYYRNYDAYLAAAIIGLVNTVLYLLSTVFAYRSYKFV